MLFDDKKRQVRHRRREIEELIDDEMIGLLEPGIEMEGKMKFSTGLIRLNSQLKGEIACEGTIIVHDQGEVEADIHCRSLSIGGKVKGTVHAAERIEICEHGVVLGDIYTPCLIIHPGGYFDGQCHMPTPGPQKPERQAQDASGHNP